jgi:predicted N-acetyltransferase YhbS
MEMEIVELGPLTAAQRRELEGDEIDPFDEAGITLRYQPKERHVLLRDKDGRLVASSGLLVVDVDAGGERFPVVGLGGVIVNANYRGRGLGREVVEAALGRAVTLGPAFALLFCHEDRAGLYLKLGFAYVDSDVIVEESGGPMRMPQRTMWRPLRDGAQWPDGPVVLCSRPF